MAMVEASRIASARLKFGSSGAGFLATSQVVALGGDDLALRYKLGRITKFYTRGISNKLEVQLVHRR